MLELACSSVFFGRCDTHGRDSSPHAGDCKRTPPPPPSLQYRHRQETQGKGRLMRVCGLRRLESPAIERVRRAPARGPGVAQPRRGEQHPPLSSLSTRRISLPGLGHRFIGCPQGTSWLREDDMYLKAAKIPPGGRLRRGSGQSAWDYPQGSERLGLPTGLETLCPCH